MPLVSKMRKRELVVPLSMEPTKTSSPLPFACIVSEFVFPWSKSITGQLTMVLYLGDAGAKFATVGAR